MNNKEFLSTLSAKQGNNLKETERLIGELVSCIAESIDENTTLSIQGFGNFDIKKKLERVVVNPANKKRFLIPPKLVLNFKPSQTLKDKFRE